MRSSLKILSFVAAIVLVVMVFNGCQQPTAPEEVVPSKEIEIKSKSIPESVWEGKEFEVRYEVSGDENFTMMYELSFGSDKRDGRVPPTGVISERFTAPQVTSDSTYSVALKVYYEEYAKSMAEDKADVVVKYNNPPQIKAVDVSPSQAEFSIENSPEDSVPIAITVEATDDTGIEAGEVQWTSATGSEKRSIDFTTTPDGYLKGTVVIPVTLNDFMQNNYAVIFTIIVKDYQKESVVERRVVAKVKGGLTVRIDGDNDVIGSKNDSIKFVGIFEKGTVEVSPDDFKWEVIDSKGNVLLDGTVNPANFSVDANTARMEVLITSDMLKEAGAEDAGEYTFRMEYTKGEENAVKPTDSVEFYYYPKIDLETAISLELTPAATNNDECADIYKGDEGFEFTLKVNGDATILVKKDFIDFGFSLKTSEPEYELPEDWEEVGDYYIVKLPATIKIKLAQLTTDSTEVDSATANVTFKLADGAELETEAALDKPIDSKPPVFEITGFTRYDPRTIWISYELEDANFKSGTLTFYVDDTAVATYTDLEVGEHKNIPIALDLYWHFDRSDLNYSFEVYDKVGHPAEGNNEVQDTGLDVDSAVGTVTAEWVSEVGEYYNATELKLKVVVEDESGVNPADVSVDLGVLNDVYVKVSTDIETSNPAEDPNYYSHLELILTYELEDGQELEVPASAIQIKVTDHEGNNFILNANANVFKFPPEGFVYDTKDPEPKLTLEKDGKFEIVNPDTYFDYAVVEASVSNSGFKTLFDRFTEDSTMLTKEVFEEAGLPAPNGDPVTIKVTAYDKAGNKGEATVYNSLVDIIPPALDAEKTKATETINFSNSKAEFDIVAAKGTYIDYLGFSGGDLSEASIIINGTEYSCSEDPCSIDLSPDPTEVNVVVTFPNGATLESGTSIEVIVGGYDNTYPTREIGRWTVDYSAIMPSEDLISSLYAVEGTYAYWIFKLNTAQSNYTFADISGVAWNGSYGDDIYVFKDETSGDSATITIDTDSRVATLTIAKGAFSMKVSYSDAEWIVKNLEAWTKVLKTANFVMTLNEFVPVPFSANTVEPDDALNEILGTYYWDLTRATEITIKLPVVEGLSWESIDTSATNTFNVVVDSTTGGTEVTLKVTFDTGDGILDSTDYTDGATKSSEAAATPTLFGDNLGASPLVYYYAKNFMDYYKVTVVASDATIAVDNTVATLTIDLTLAAEVLPSSALFITTTVPASFASNDSSGTAFSADDTGISLSGDSLTIVLTTTATTAFNETTTGTSAIADIALDGIKFQLKPEGFTNGFWITNFDAAINIR